MWDSDDDREKRAGRGSMLDFASRASPRARISARFAPENRVEDPATRQHAGSLLSLAPSARLSTRPHATLSTPAAGGTGRTLKDRPAPEGVRKERLGARIISLLIGREIGADEPQSLSRNEMVAKAGESGLNPGHPFEPSPESGYHPAPGYGTIAADHRPTFGESGERPLLDLSILMASVWRCRWLIAAATALGTVAGVLIALATPHQYYAETRLFMDPREIRLTEEELRNPLMSTEAMIAMTDSQIAILTSTNVLMDVVDELDLARDPEFNGSLNAGGISGGIAVLRQLLSGTDANTEAETEALTYLRENLNIGRDPKTFVINVGFVSRDPGKAALVANSVAESYLQNEGAAQSNLMERASEAIDTRLEALRADLNAAERAVENYRAENDLVAVGDQLIDEQQVATLSRQLANARASKVAARVKAENLQEADVAVVIGGAFPEEFLSANLVELRKQYAQSKANADSLGSRLGPRHPQFIAAQSSLESITGQIRTELRRIVASSQSELQRAVETEQELASQLAVAKTRSLDSSEELVTLRELQRKAAATRQIYEAFLKRSRETSERGNLNTQNARVISPAEPPLSPDGPSRKVIALGGMFGGAAIGIGIALLLGTIESLRNFLPGPGGFPGGEPGGGNGFGRDRASPIAPHETNIAFAGAVAQPQRTRSVAQMAAERTPADRAATANETPTEIDTIENEIAMYSAYPGNPAYPTHPADEPRGHDVRWPGNSPAPLQHHYPVYGQAYGYPQHPGAPPMPQPQSGHGSGLYPQAQYPAYAHPAPPQSPHPASAFAGHPPYTQDAHGYPVQPSHGGFHSTAQAAGASARDRQRDEEIDRIRGEMALLRDRIDRQTRRRAG